MSKKEIKYHMRYAILLLSVMLTATGSNAQIGNRLKDQLNQRKDAKVNNAINKGLDRLEGKGKNPGQAPGQPQQGDGQTEEPNQNPAPAEEKTEEAAPAAPTQASVSPEKSYARFDFIPGEKVMFEDNFQNETDDEVPSYWIPTKGQVEVSTINGEKVMGLLEESSTVYPRRAENNSKNATRTTLEFDYLFRKNNGTMMETYRKGAFGNEYFTIQFAVDEDFYDNDKQMELGDFIERLDVTSLGKVTFGKMNGDFNQGKTTDMGYVKAYDDITDKWVHVSVAITERSMKVYLNSQRVINSVIGKGRSFTFQISCFSCSSDNDGYQVFFKNVRIAEGGADPYKQLVTDGRMIARGITFDVGKATLKPESFGELNAIAELMKQNAQLKFEVGGHTDSDGDDASNMKLSQQRAETVRGKLMELGIDGARLTAKGYGETKPLMPNSTTENKANNRRVELVKS